MPLALEAGCLIHAATEKVEAVDVGITWAPDTEADWLEPFRVNAESIDEFEVFVIV